MGSCAWNQSELRDWAKDERPRDDRKLREAGAKGDELKRFSLDETPETPPKAPPSAAPRPVPTKPVVTVPGKAPRPAPTVPTPPVAVKPAPAAKLTSPPRPVAKEYPEGYPEDLKALDQKARRSWEKFRPVFTPNETLFLDVDYLGMTVGKVMLAYRGIKSMGGQQVHHFQARFKTAPFYSAVYELDDHIDAFVAKEGFLSLRSNLVQRESKQDVDEIQLFDRASLKTKAFQKRVRDGKTKEKTWKGWIPRYSTDSLSVIHIIRGLQLSPGDAYVIPIVNKGKVVVMELKAEARERIKTNRGERSALRVSAHTQYTGRTLKSGDMTFWLAETPGRELLRAQAKIKIGSVSAELAEGE